MPIVRCAGLPSAVSCCHVASRVARIRSTIMSIACVERQLLPVRFRTGGRYLTLYSRSGPA